MTKLDDALANVSTLGFDTAPLIYFIEANPRYDALITEIFRRVDAGKLSGMTSVISLCEVLVYSFVKDDPSLRQSYRNLLLNSANFVTHAINDAMADHAAELRAKYRIKTPDALQIAMALSTNCEAFLTNDKDLKRVAEIQILVLNELEL